MLGLLFLGSCNVRAESDNPFGFETQTHPLQYEYCKKVVDKKAVDYHFSYECSSAPRMHPDIEQIYLRFVEGVGLCSIAAASFRIGKRFSLDDFKEQIAKTYGPPTNRTKDEDSAGNEYNPGYAWDRKEGFLGRGDVTSIRIHKNVAHRVILSFLMAPFDECGKAVDQKRTEAF